MWAGQLSSFDRRRAVLSRGACAGEPLEDRHGTRYLPDFSLRRAVGGGMYAAIFVTTPAHLPSYRSLWSLPYACHRLMAKARAKMSPGASRRWYETCLIAPRAMGAEHQRRTLDISVTHRPRASRFSSKPSISCWNTAASPY